MKKDIGSAGDGNEWHHIVEQSQGQKSGFSSQLINNPDNVVSIPSDVHRKLSGYYSSKQPFSEEILVRDWLATKSYEYQYAFGLEILKSFLGK